MAKNLTDEQLLLLVDSATESDEIHKRHEKLVKLVKPVLMEHAKLNKWKTRAGEKGVATIKPSTSTEIKPTDLLRKLVTLGKKHLFDTVFSVRVTDSREYLGNDELADISDTQTKEFGSISLKVK